MAQETNRGRIYRMLRDAGDQGVPVLAFLGEGLSSISPHLESLRFEGCAIHEIRQPAKGGAHLELRYYMTKDPWA